MPSNFGNLFGKLFFESAEKLLSVFFFSCWQLRKGLAPKNGTTKQKSNAALYYNNFKVQPLHDNENSCDVFIKIIFRK